MIRFWNHSIITRLETYTSIHLLFEAQIGPLHGMWLPGFAWLRIGATWGYAIKDSRRVRLLASERFGVATVRWLGPWIVRKLPPLPPR